VQKLLNTALAATFAVMATSLPAWAEETKVVPESQAQVLLSFSPVVKASMPAVVNIYTRKTVAVRNR